MKSVRYNISSVKAHRSKSSSKWLARQHRDQYVLKSKADGYRSRAAYKLLAMQKKYTFIRSGQVVVDLGGAPGGWSQVAVNYVGKKGLVIALDLLPMSPITGVEIVQGDFTQTSVFSKLLEKLNQKNNRKADLVISDMSPNISGILAVDQAKSMALVEAAFDFAQCVLKPEGFFLLKLFQGEGIDAFLLDLKRVFSIVKTVKPEASRMQSREIYVLAQNFRSYKG